MNDSKCPLAEGASVGKCWESTVGQELFKVSTIDLLSVVSGVIIGDFFRSALVRCLPACRTKEEVYIQIFKNKTRHDSCL